MSAVARMSFITTPENEIAVKNLADRFNLKTSRCIHTLITSILDLDPAKLWQLQAASDILGFNITEDIKALIETRSAQTRNN